MKKLILLLLLLIAAPAHAWQINMGSWTGNQSNNQDICYTTGTGCEFENTCVAADSNVACADFTPNVVLVRCDAASTNAVIKTSSMASTSACYITSTTCATSFITALNTNGFRVPNSAITNTSAVTCHYVALGTDANNDMAVGTYAGDGQATHAVTISPAFQPVLVIIRKEGTTATNIGMVFFHASMQSTTTSCMGGAANLAAVVSLDASGFTVNADDAVNASGSNYSYVAFKALTGGVAYGNYTANGSDARQFTTLSFLPKVLFDKVDAVAGGAYRFATIGTDSTDLSWSGNAVSAANKIQQFLANGFEVGTDTSVNSGSTNKQNWFALGAYVYPTPNPRRRININGD